MAWMTACEYAAIADGEAVCVQRAGGQPVAVFRVDGEFFATEDTCPHGQYSLADGYITNNVVECPLHFAKFDVRTGAVLSLPANRDLETFVVKVEDGVVFVDA
jgi:nitrite reductase/ring-hydroxylating ferredoxin subunit